MIFIIIFGANSVFVKAVSVHYLWLTLIFHKSCQPSLSSLL